MNKPKITTAENFVLYHEQMWSCVINKLKVIIRRFGAGESMHTVSLRRRNLVYYEPILMSYSSSCNLQSAAWMNKWVGLGLEANHVANALRDDLIAVI